MELRTGEWHNLTSSTMRHCSSHLPRIPANDTTIILQNCGTEIILLNEQILLLLPRSLSYYCPDPCR